jgi:carbon starvation protein CstA
MGRSGEQIRAEFAKRQGRQSVAIAAAMLLIIVFAILYARPGWLGPNSRGTIFSAQIVVIAAFIGFTYHNWRCPACQRHLGGDLHRRMCGKCRERLH